MIRVQGKKSYEPKESSKLRVGKGQPLGLELTILFTFQSGAE